MSNTPTTANPFTTNHKIQLPQHPFTTSTIQQPPQPPTPNTTTTTTTTTTPNIHTVPDGLVGGVGHDGVRVHVALHPGQHLRRKRVSGLVTVLHGHVVKRPVHQRRRWRDTDNFRGGGGGGGQWFQHERVGSRAFKGGGLP